MNGNPEIKKIFSYPEQSKSSSQLPNQSIRIVNKENTKIKEGVIKMRDEKPQTIRFLKKVNIQQVNQGSNQNTNRDQKEEENKEESKSSS